MSRSAALSVVLALVLAGCSGGNSSPKDYGAPTIAMIEASSFGANGQDALDDTAAITAAVAALTPNQTLHFAAGTYLLDSATLAACPILIPCNHVAITGESSASTRIELTGTTAAPWMFAATGRHGLAFSDLSFVGNNQASSYGNGGCVVFTNSQESASGLTVRDCHFENFKGDFWVHVENVSGDEPITDVSVSWCTFLTKPGNSRLPQSITCPQGMVGIVAHNSSLSGGIDRIRIDSNSVQCQHAKGLLALFGNCSQISVCNNLIAGAGTSDAFANDSACYAILCYNNFKPPRHAVISANRIIGVRDCGMYLLECEDFVVSGNVVTDQTSTAYETLPKAGIALNGMTRTDCSGNAISNIQTGIYFQGGKTVERSSSVIAANAITGAARAGITIESSAFPWHDLLVSGNSLYSSAQGVFIAVTAPISNVTIESNKIRSSSWGVRAISSDELYRMDRLTVVGNTITSDTSYHVSHVSVRGFTNCQSAIANNVFYGFSYVPIDVYGSTGITISGNITP